MTARTVAADASVRRGRLAKAEQFATAAAELRHSSDGAADLDDVYVTLCVHAGIAAADVICARKLDVHAQGQNHRPWRSCVASTGSRRATSTPC